MVTIDDILNTIIRNEGGFVNNPADNGGPTKYGITQATLESYLGRSVTIDEIQNLSVDQAKEIYSRRYYRNPGFDQIPNDIQPIVVDASVLYGPKRAIIFLQEIINQANFGPIDVDGVLGPDTKSRINTAYSQMGPYFINAYCDARINFCQRIVANNPSQSIFLRGWTNRANSFRVQEPS